MLNELIKLNCYITKKNLSMSSLAFLSLGG